MSVTDVPGVVTVQGRALAQVVRALVRDLLGTPPSQTSVDLAPGESGLHVQIAAPIRLPAADSSALVQLHEARARIAARVLELTDRHVSDVELRVTGLLQDAPRRVR